MNIKRLINSPIGKIIISIILGLGLATIFRKACKDKNCITFNGPIISTVEGKIYKHGDKCYNFSATSEKCDNSKKIIDIGEPEQLSPSASIFK